MSKGIVTSVYTTIPESDKDGDGRVWICLTDQEYTNTQLHAIIDHLQEVADKMKAEDLSTEARSGSVSFE